MWRLQLSERNEVGHVRCEACAKDDAVQRRRVDLSRGQIPHQILRQVIADGSRHLLFLAALEQVLAHQPDQERGWQLHERRGGEGQPEIGLVEAPLKEPGIKCRERENDRDRCRRRQKIGENPGDQAKRCDGERIDHRIARLKRSPAQQIGVGRGHDLDAAEIDPVLAGEARIEAVWLIGIVEIGIADKDHVCSSDHRSARWLGRRRLEAETGRGWCGRCRADHRS